MQEILDLSRNLCRVLDDNWAVERRCVPGKDVLEKIINILLQVRQNLTIQTFTFDDYKTIFQFILKAHNYELNNVMPTDEVLALIVKTFEYVIKENNREQANLDSEDLWVLCLLFNIVSYQKNKYEYLEKFKAWKI